KQYHFWSLVSAQVMERNRCAMEPIGNRLVFPNREPKRQREGHNPEYLDVASAIPRCHYVFSCARIRVLAGIRWSRESGHPSPARSDGLSGNWLKRCVAHQNQNCLPSCELRRSGGDSCTRVPSAGINVSEREVQIMESSRPKLPPEA